MCFTHRVGVISKETMTQLYQVMLDAAEVEVNAANAMASARDTVVGSIST